MVEFIKGILGLKRTTGNWYFDNLNSQVVSDLRCKTRRVPEPPDETPLDEGRLVVFDLETTGLYPYAGDEIISIGAVVVEHGEIDYNQTFDRLINPYRPISADTIEITGITDDMLVGEEGVFEVLSSFLDFAGDSVLVAHNAAFDLNFINLRMRRHCHSKIINPVVDTMEISQALFSTRRSHSLDSLADSFNIPLLGRHSALGDSIITAQILVTFLPLLKARGIRTFQDLSNFFRCHSFR